MKEEKNEKTELDFPCYMYHQKFGAKVFKDEKELKEAGKGWVDSPAKLQKEK